MRNPSFNFADFTVTCPDAAVPDSPVHQIRARGNLPLLLEHDMVIELKRSDLLENWRETCALGRARVEKLVHQTAARIHAALDDDEWDDLPSLASDTVAFFLLALRQKGVKFPCNIPACNIQYILDKEEGHHSSVLMN
jgi:hypothetical protein